MALNAEEIPAELEDEALSEEEPELDSFTIPTLLGAFKPALAALARFVPAPPPPPKQPATITESNEIEIVLIIFKFGLFKLSSSKILNLLRQVYIFFLKIYISN